MDICNILPTFGIFYDHSVHFVFIWYILFWFWYHATRKIWQPCATPQLGGIHISSFASAQKTLFYRLPGRTLSTKEMSVTKNQHRNNADTPQGRFVFVAGYKNWSARFPKAQFTLGSCYSELAMAKLLVRYITYVNLLP
jgi:hypothetical protein